MERCGLIANFRRSDVREKRPDGIALRVVQIVERLNAQTCHIRQRGRSHIVHHRDKTANLRSEAGSFGDQKQVGITRQDHDNGPIIGSNQRRTFTRAASIYLASRRMPRADDNTSALLDNATALSPPSRWMHASPNAIVEHAARVHASTGPAVTAVAVTARAPLHV